VDYRKFLGAQSTKVLPYFGGAFVHAPDRRLRVTARVAVGWWDFEIKGRNATATAVAEPPSLHRCKSLRGHIVDDWLFVGSEATRRILMMPDDRPAVLSPVTARVWHGDAPMFDVLEFEGDAEEAARGALLEGGAIADLTGATPSLRRAFGFARLHREGQGRGLHVSVREVEAVLHEVADGMRDPLAVLDALEARVYTLHPSSDHRARGPVLTGVLEDAPTRAAAALEAAGATLLDTRLAGERTMEVTFRYLDERFIATVDWETLHVYDSGICLDGADEELGLDALPSVISEAIDGGMLHITRR
jgi:hypothetical protein